VQNCRFGPKRDIPFEIPPGASEFLECNLEVIKPGRFSSQLEIFVADPGVREVVLSVSGTAQAVGTEGL
jgi:hypothetical protein